MLPQNVNKYIIEIIQIIITKQYQLHSDTMSIPNSIICRYKKTWFDSLSMDQLRDLCRAANISHTNRNKLDVTILLCEKEISSSFESSTVKSIKDMCRSRSLPVTGNKYQLVLRILAHDSLKATTGNESRVSVEHMCRQMENVIIGGSDIYYWFVDAIAEIRYSTHQAHDYDLSDYICVEGYQTPLAAFRDTESAFAVLIKNFQCIPNAGVDDLDSLSEAIDHLAFILVEARVFLGKTEKKAAVAWILVLDHVLSEYMLGENSKTSLKELVQLLEEDSCHLHKSVNSIHPELVIPAKKVFKRQRESGFTRTPLRCLKNDTNKVPSKVIALAAIATKKPKPKPKLVTNKKEIVYKKMAGVLRRSGKNSDYVYERLLRLMKSILSQSDDYEALGLFRSAFVALIVHFEKMDDPGRDTDHHFTIAIDLLGNVVETVMGVLSTKEKDETLRWMNDLQNFTRPYALGEIAELPLNELIRMVKESKAAEQKTKPRRFFFL
jgi:hypothetical protein